MEGVLVFTTLEGGRALHSYVSSFCLIHIGEHFQETSGGPGCPHGGAADGRGLDQRAAERGAWRALLIYIYIYIYTRVYTCIFFLNILL